MFQGKSYFMAAILAGALALTSCATSNMVVGTWRDKDYHKKISKVLVVGLSNDMAMRRAFEDTLVAKFRKRGTTAIASVDILPLGKDIDRATVKSEIQSAIKGKGFNAVLVTRLINVDKSSSYIPPADYPKYSFYSTFMTTYSSVYTPGYLVNTTVVSLETDLYDTASQKLVWSMTSQSFNPEDAKDVIDPLSHYIVKDLALNGML